MPGRSTQDIKFEFAVLARIIHPIANVIAFSAFYVKVGLGVLTTLELTGLTGLVTRDICVWGNSVLMVTRHKFYADRIYIEHNRSMDH